MRAFVSGVFSLRFECRSNVTKGTSYNLAAALIFKPSSLIALSAERNAFASIGGNLRLYVRGMSKIEAQIK